VLEEKPLCFYSLQPIVLSYTVLVPFPHLILSSTLNLVIIKQT
jgi:hypothetical protein